MITVKALVLLVCFTSSTYSCVTVQSIPTLEACNTLGIAMRAGRSGSTHKCIEYDALIISQGGNVPNTNYLLAQ